jgi:hypothetical protein
MMLGLAVHDAFGWKGRRERFCSAKLRSVRDSATAGVINGTVPAEATGLVMMPVG